MCEMPDVIPHRDAPRIAPLAALGIPEERKVWCLENNDGYDSGPITFAVFSSEELAEAALERALAKEVADETIRRATLLQKYGPEFLNKNPHYLGDDMEAWIASKRYEYGISPFVLDKVEP